ncbi:PilW family protein [Crenothrix sp.]|uniref:PilW family protein n=1 Tax=Crenothrix sp. TaxID=3100433 RepID=UPI00374D3C85
MKHAFYQRGFTLIEIMVAMLLGVFLLGGILQVFLHSKQTYRTQEALSRLQEDGRFAMDFLIRDIRMAGFMGCSSQTAPASTLSASTDFLYRFDKAIEGFESTSATAWTPAKDPSITSPLGGSDIISIRRVDDQSFTVTAQTSSTDGLTLDSSATTTNLKAAGFLKNTPTGGNNCAIALVTDCSMAAIFQVSGIAGTVLTHAKDGACTPKNALDNLGRTYIRAQVYSLSTISYYVGENPNNQPALYTKKGAKAEEMVEGIEQMQILYGVNTDASADGTPNYYVTADKVKDSDWPKVMSVRISLLVVSIDNNLTDKPISYTYNGHLVQPDKDDRRLRKIFTSTIALRNRLS